MDGLDDLDQALATLVGALDGASLQACTDAAAQPVLQEALQRVPRRSGETAAHITTSGHHGAHSATTAIEVADSGPGGGVHKAVFLEYGTVNMPAEPYMRPAFEIRKNEALQVLEQQLQGKLKEFQ